jgi:hypothetical protein
MKIRTVALAMGGAVLIALGGVGAVACSSDEGTGTPTNNNTDKDATTTGDTGPKPTTDSSTPVGDAGVDAPTYPSTCQHVTAKGAQFGFCQSGPPPSDAGDAVDCGKVPTLHPAEAGTGPYCPFSSVGDAGNLTCAQGQHCCEHPADAGTPSTCQASTCGTTDTDWMCQDQSNCPSGQVCCAITSGPGQDPGCSFYFLHGFKGTACRTSCAQGELTVCESDDQCK